MKTENEKKINGKCAGLLLASLIIIIIIIPNTSAHCPLCTGATIVGVGITRSLGWDDSIVGVFVGAMIVSSALWVNKILKKRNVGGNAFMRVSSIIIVTFVLTILTFYYAGIFGPANMYRIFGMEKILFGSISGGVVSLLAFFASNGLKKRNYGKVLFSYQTIVITFTALILNAILFWMVF